MNALQEARARYVVLLLDRLERQEGLDLDLCERIERMLGIAAPAPQRASLPPAEREPREPQIADVVALVARRFEVTPEMMTGPSRAHPEVLARQLAMRLCRELLGKTYPEIGRAFNRDHATVIHACEVTESMAIGDLVEELTA